MSGVMAPSATVTLESGTPTLTATRTFHLAIGIDVDAADLVLGVTRDGPWAGWLGGFDLPDAPALDRLAAAAEAWTAAPERVVLSGAPAAALLPLLWLRTIWLTPDTPAHLRWSAVAAPGPDPRERLAARLCCGLVEHVACDAPDEARSVWGIDPGPVAPMGAEALDLVLGLVDAWDVGRRTGFITDPGEWHARVHAALTSLGDRGRSRVAIYGAGTHTRALGALLREPPVEIRCIVDDDETLHGRRMWGFPIVSRREALAMGIDAVLLSANAHEPALRARCEPFVAAGVAVVGLYPEIGADAGPAS
jgi:hypothetical protein